MTPCVTPQTYPCMHALEKVPAFLALRSFPFWRWRLSRITKKMEPSCCEDLASFAAGFRLAFCWLPANFQCAPWPSYWLNLTPVLADLGPRFGRVGQILAAPNLGRVLADLGRHCPRAPRAGQPPAGPRPQLDRPPGHDRSSTAGPRPQRDRRATPAARPTAGPRPQLDRPPTATATPKKRAAHLDKASRLFSAS